MRALIKLLLCFFFGFLFYFLGGSALLFRHVTLWWPVYIRVQKCISRAEPSAPQKHTNAAQLSSELAKKYECNKETKERTSLTFVSLSLLLRYRLQSSDWRWRVRGAVVGIHSGLSRVARTTIAFEAMGRFYFFLTPSLLMKYAFGVETACRLMGYHTWVSENTIPTIPTPYDDRRLVCTKGYRGKKSGRIPFLLDSYYSTKTFFSPFHSHPPFVKCAK